MKIIQFVMTVVLGAIIVSGVFNLINGDSSSVNVSYDSFVKEVESSKMESVIFRGNVIEYNIGEELYNTRLPTALGDKDLLNQLIKSNITVIDKEPKRPNAFVSLILNVLPFFIVLGVIAYFLKKQGEKMSPNTSLGNKIKILEPSQENITFADVAGCDDAKDEVKEIVDFLSNPHKYWDLGAKIPRGVLLQGPPGNGKTLLAKAVAGEANRPFIAISGSDFVEKYVGTGASRVRELFEKAKENAPCIVFIDEIDAMGRQRSGGGGGGNDEREQTLNQMLVEMDGFGSQDSVIIIAATNRADILDKALTRPGRFDRQVTVGLPDVKGRKDILEVHTKDKKTTQDVNIKEIAQGTVGFSGAELANLVNEAAICSVRKNKKTIDQESFEEAKDKIIMGSARQGFVMSEKEKSLTAYHEAGHAIVGHHFHGENLHDPVYKVSIIPRERSLGVTVYLPENDKYSISRGEAMARLQTLFGGRIAEEMVADDDGITGGASNDIERATQLATRMVTNLGLSDLGNGIRQFRETDGYSEKPFVSGKKGDDIDNTIQAILDEAYNSAKKLLDGKKDELNAMHNSLMVKETIHRKDVENIMKGEILDEYDTAKTGYFAE